MDQNQLGAKMTNIQITDEQKRIAKEYFVAVVMLRTLESVVTEYQEQILIELQACVRDPFKAWTLPNSIFEKYVQRCHEERDKRGLLVSDPQNCPLLEARHNLSKLENRFLDAMASICGFGSKELNRGADILGNRKKALELHTRLLAGAS